MSKPKTINVSLTKKKALSQTPDLDPSFAYSFRQLLNYSGNNNSTPYKDYVWVYACASAISRNIRRLPISYYKASNEEDIPNSQMKKYYNLFSKPNGFMTQSDFIEAIVLFLLLPSKNSCGGQVFIMQDYDEKVSLYTDAVPTKLFVYNDDQVSPASINGKFVGWALTIDGQQPKIFAPNEVVRIRLLNPYDLLKGMSPYSAASLSVNTDNNASQMTDSFYKNAGVINGVLTTEQKLNPVQADELKKNWAESYGGGGNSGKTPVLHSGLDFKSVSNVSPKDIGLIDQKKLSREEVIASYGVPKFLLGLTEDLNRATAEAALSHFWENVLVPLTEVIADSFNSQWFNFVGNGDVKMWLDTSKVDALKKDITTKISNADILIKQGVPPSQAYSQTGLPTVENAPWLDKPLVTGTRVDLSTGEVIGSPYPVYVPEQSTEIPPTETPTETPTEGTAKKPKEDATQETGKKSCSHSHKNHINLSTPEFRTKYWNDYIEKVFDPLERAFDIEMQKYFTEQEEIINKLVDQLDINLKSIITKENFNIVVKAIEVDVTKLLLAKSAEDKRLKKAVAPMYKKIIKDQSSQVKKEIGNFVAWNQTNPSVTKFALKRIKDVEQINTTTFQMLNKKVGKTIAETISQIAPGGEDTPSSVNAVVKAIKEAVKETYGIRLNNAKTIARTETAVIASETRFDIFTAEGITKHEWVSAQDEKVRTDEDGEFDHASADGEIVKVGEAFSDTGEELLHPSDPNGSAGNVINCRCVALAVIDD